MEHILCFQVLVSLKPKFSSLASAAVLTDAADATVAMISSEHGKSNDMHLGLAAGRSILRHSTFTTKQEISWQKLPGFIAEKMIFTNYCSVVGGMTFSHLLLYFGGVQCSWVTLCLAVYRCLRSGVDGSVLS